jgi:hypothetical protein
MATFNKDTIVTGVRFPKTTIEGIDRVRGYYSRNKLLRKLAEEYIAAQENSEQKNKNNNK